MFTDKGREEVLYYENFDLENVVTPVDADILEKMLLESNYDKEKTDFLVTGFRQGFSLEYEGPEDIKINSPNLRLEVGSETTLWNKVMKEMKLKRYAGPFSSIPFDNNIQSPIGLVPKDEHDTRLIFHLSYPRGTGKSVNANTPVEKSTVKYPDFNDAIQLCIRE